MRITLQVLASAALFVAVLWGMWRLPRSGESLLGWAPPMALLGPWAGATAVVVSLLLWVLPHPDRWVALTFLALEPLAIGSGVLVLWLYRGHELDSQTIGLQRIQAKVAILLGACAVVASYVYVMMTKAPFTPVGP